MSAPPLPPAALHHVARDCFADREQAAVIAARSWATQ
jgi:hypothetical protein